MNKGCSKRTLSPHSGPRPAPGHDRPSPRVRVPPGTDGRRGTGGPGSGTASALPFRQSRKRRLSSFAQKLPQASPEPSPGLGAPARSARARGSEWGQRQLRRGRGSCRLEWPQAVKAGVAPALRAATKFPSLSSSRQQRPAPSGPGGRKSRVRAPSGGPGGGPVQLQGTAGRPRPS